MKINKNLPLPKVIDAMQKRLKDYEKLIVDLRIKLSRKEREIFDLKEQLSQLKQ